MSTAPAGTQTLAALANLEALLAAAGTSKELLVEVTLLVSDMQDVDEVQAGWRAWLPRLDGSLPVKHVLVSPSAYQRLGCRVELKAIAKAA